MLLLVLDVFDDAILVVIGMSERAITVLPIRETRERLLFFDPFIARHLEVFDQFRQTDRGMQAGEDVKVILDAIER